MRDCYHKICRVDIEPLLKRLPEVQFVDTGGPNGWLSFPPPQWALDFIDSLQPPGRVTFPMLRKLPAFQNLPPHKDDWGNTANLGRRMHVPLVSHPDVTMRWPEDDVEVHLEPGWLWEVNYLKLHEVRHRAPIGRIHLHFNVVS